MRTELALAIIGPTASGKTELAVECAQEVSGQLIGTDSMQAYQHLSIGTAKPTPSELHGITHHMLDLWPISHVAHVAEFQQIARARIRDVYNAGDLPIVVGGSVLYVNSVLDVYDFPGTDPAVRSHYVELLDSQGSMELHKLLEARDPEAARNIAPSNGRRIVRALEVIDITGKPFTASLPKKPEVFVSACRIGLDIDRDTLDRRIESRVEAMLANGLIQEVESALDNGLRECVTARKAIGYSQIIQVVDGEISLDEAQSQMVSATSKFARRQQRWFRQDSRITWFPWDADDLRSRVLVHFDKVLGTHKGSK